VSQHDPPASDDAPKKKFRITRKRLGTIRFVDPKGDYGFIEAEDFRDDVYFHHSAWCPDEAPAGGPLASRQATAGKSDDRSRQRSRYGDRQNRSPKLVAEQLVQKHVEFEIDDDLFEQEKRLRATIVMPTRRPMGRRLSGRDATFKIVTHHPKARRKRPDWR